MSELHDGQSCEEREASFRLLLKRVGTVYPTFGSNALANPLNVETTVHSDQRHSRAPHPGKLERLELHVLELETLNRSAVAYVGFMVKRNLKLRFEVEGLRALLKEAGVMP